jgi:hypothetical protein
MSSLFAGLHALRERQRAAFLAQHGRAITIIVKDSQTQAERAHSGAADDSYDHFIAATWTDPATGKTHAFHHQFRSRLANHFKIGDMVHVLLDPHNFRRYIMQVE